ncbi:MAG: hypothetical protein LCI00_12055 [Chloroflexi bacterium]|nr:hypothetical protein [Chloroflexota bacterium]MCC6896259.1 hypothetical protein [Anaerolineae bacterium]
MGRGTAAESDILVVMGQFYCRDCGINRGWDRFNFPSNPTGNIYQQEKYIKHTNSTAYYGINSKFDDPNAYVDYAYSASALGFYEQDSKGRISVIWDAGKRVGETNALGTIRPDSAIKFVHHRDPNKIHGLPTGMNTSIICAGCGCRIK